MDQGGGASLEWENLPPHAYIDVIFHCYQAEYPILVSHLLPSKP